MLDENRIKTMTRMASYEENEGRKTIPIASFFRGDYISLHVVVTVLGATIAFAIVIGMYIYYNMETLIADVYKLDLITVGKQILKVYGILVGVYAVLSYIIYSIRYDRAWKSLHGYNNALKKLAKMYDDSDEE